MASHHGHLGWRYIIVGEALLAKPCTHESRCAPQAIALLPEDFDFDRRVFFALAFGFGSAAAVVRTRSARNSGSSRSAIKNQLLAPGNGGASVGTPILARPGSVAF